MVLLLTLLHLQILFFPLFICEQSFAFSIVIIIIIFFFYVFNVSIYSDVAEALGAANRQVYFNLFVFPLKLITVNF